MLDETNSAYIELAMLLAQEDRSERDWHSIGFLSHILNPEVDKHKLDYILRNAACDVNYRLVLAQLAAEAAGL